MRSVERTRDVATMWNPDVARRLKSPQEDTSCGQQRLANDLAYAFLRRALTNAARPVARSPKVAGSGTAAVPQATAAKSLMSLGPSRGVTVTQAFAESAGKTKPSAFDRNAPSTGLNDRFNPVVPGRIAVKFSVAKVNPVPWRASNAALLSDASAIKKPSNGLLLPPVNPEPKSKRPAPIFPPGSRVNPVPLIKLSSNVTRNEAPPTALAVSPLTITSTEKFVPWLTVTAGGVMLIVVALARGATSRPAIAARTKKRVTFRMLFIVLSPEAALASSKLASASKRLRV